MFKTALYHLPSCHIWIPRSFVCFFFIHSNYEIGIFRIISPGLLSSTCRHLKAGNTIVSSLPKSWLLFSSCVRCCLLGKMIDPEGERRGDSFWFSDCVVRARVSSLWRRSIIFLRLVACFDTHRSVYKSNSACRDFAASSFKTQFQSKEKLFSSAISRKFVIFSDLASAVISIPGITELHIPLINSGSIQKTSDSNWLVLAKLYDILLNADSLLHLLLTMYQNWPSASWDAIQKKRMTMTVGMHLLLSVQQFSSVQQILELNKSRGNCNKI